MTLEDKKTLFRGMISPDTIEDEALTALLTVSESIILNKMYPFGYEDGKTVPQRYGSLQVEIAIEVWNHRGAEGQISHSENGISRGWESAGVSSTLLSRITPAVGSVVSFEKSEP